MSSSSGEHKQTSFVWYLLPILLGILGGVIAYLVTRKDDPVKAKNCLIIGIVVTAASVIMYAVTGASLLL